MLKFSNNNRLMLVLQVLLASFWPKSAVAPGNVRSCQKWAEKNNIIRRTRFVHAIFPASIGFPRPGFSHPSETKQESVTFYKLLTINSCP